MYFVFEDEVCTWRNQILQATIQGDIPSYQPHWWDCELLITPLPMLTFAINSKARLLDNYLTGTEFALYSSQFINHLYKAGVRFESFPAKIVDRKTKQELSVKYEVFHVLELYPGLDKEHSDIDEEELEIRKLVLTETCLQEKRPLFRLQESEDLVLIHQDLKATLEASGITGCKYTPVNEFRSSIRFYFEDKG